mgnify:CR=1 FL=1
MKLAVRNDTSDPVVAAARVTDADGNAVFEETGITVEPDDSSEDFPVTEQFGEYEVAVEFADGHRATEAWYVGPPNATSRNLGGTVVRSSDGTAFRRNARVYDKPICPWDER